MRIPTVSERLRRGAATRDENADGRVDEYDDRIATERADDERLDDHDVDDRVSRHRYVARAKVDEREAARNRAAAEAPTVVTERPVSPAPTATAAAPASPRPRASLLAMGALVFGVTSALSVLSGILAGPGIVLGVLGIVLGFGGLAATGRRHVAGKADALLGLLLAMAAVVVGVGAFNGMVPWLSPDTDQVARAHDWLAAQLPWLFPS
ncbi:MAG: hypothetical protein ACM30G_07535 [Micromonosporaceae bacterium]